MASGTVREGALECVHLGRLHQRGDGAVQRRRRHGHPRPQEHDVGHEHLRSHRFAKAKAPPAAQMRLDSHKRARTLSSNIALKVPSFSFSAFLTCSHVYDAQHTTHPGLEQGARSQCAAVPRKQTVGCAVCVLHGIRCALQAMYSVVYITWRTPHLRELGAASQPQHLPSDPRHRANGCALEASDLPHPVSQGSQAGSEHALAAQSDAATRGLIDSAE